MASSNFIDYVKIFTRSGAGGAGAVSFRREKHVPKGGPDGGDGGRGGHIILKADKQLWTLLHLKYRKHIHGNNGVSGSGTGKSGSEGEDIILPVPLGTIAKNAETGEKICELTEDGQEVILMKGGRGGLGNKNFKTSTNQTPRYAQPGEDCQEDWVILELKVLADVGLVGFPNAGKSTLLSTLSAAKPEIADYPFTTMVPNLGVISYRDNRSFVMADIPGIIEGAAEGKGLGIRFLRHIERNSVLLFMVPADSEDIAHDYQVLVNELTKYNPELLDKNRVLAITKSDMLDDELEEMIQETLPSDVPFVFISSIIQKGIPVLKDMLWEAINEGVEEVEPDFVEEDYTSNIPSDYNPYQDRIDLDNEEEEK
ncbi:GTPase ObgE [Flammeovirga kamogawensis]|uniref:GTPase Obg n=1 Tax=Flammeovirga kamogawensis TaxID=373891 RepID=A0ABX8GT32_9BACT|nr:GTPase ObgE [Flammeovirga kamogawensis]MBB6462930.1 GTP-binding protein [Flammeovirga kamogawensis]QWG06458.1 GTPase ObgE [Flammeovirga kamogawensis]TRX68288.1 GTPase ObgE [Flammeovirga kamogawensis]